jgi:hypothetical protein
MASKSMGKKKHSGAFLLSFHCTYALLYFSCGDPLPVNEIRSNCNDKVTMNYSRHQQLLPAVVPWCCCFHVAVTLVLTPSHHIAHHLFYIILTNVTPTDASSRRAHISFIKLDYIIFDLI